MKTLFNRFTNKIIITFFLFIAAGCQLSAQTFYRATHLSGTTAVGPRIVTVTSSGPVSNVYPCSDHIIGPYQIFANTPCAYIWTFDKPVNAIRAHISPVGPLDVVSIDINGVHYMITAANLSTFSTACGSGTSVAISGGNIVGGSSSELGQTQVDITGLCATSVKIACSGSSAGIITDFNFAVLGTITGLSSVCRGSTITLSALPSGGTWSSSATAIATVNSAGVVAGVSAGTANIIYSMGSGCSISKSIRVDIAPNAGTITGTNYICGIGATTALASSGGDAGGVWSSTVPAVATVSASGVVTGVSTGTTTISYKVTNACGVDVATRTVSVYAPTEQIYYIGGDPDFFCAGTTYNYYISGTPGDSVFYKLTNSDGTVTTGAILIDAGGNGHVLVTPPGAGTVTLTLTSVKSGPCTFTTSITQVMTSYAMPVAGSITGSGVICGLGNSTTLTNVGGMPGGMWVSSTSDIDHTGGTWPNAIITGYMTGHATIHYTVINQCGTSTAYFGVDVYAPTEQIYYIGGDPDFFCAGTTYNYYISGTPGDSVFYTLTNSDGTVTTGVIVIDAGGNGHVLVTPPGAGTVTLTLTSVKSGPCTFPTSITQVMTSYAMPVAGSITGSGVICGLGNSTTLTNVGGMPGGMWVSSTSDIDHTGGTWPNAIITGYMTGHATIYYTVKNQCGTSTAYFGVDVYAPTEQIYYIGGDPDFFCAGTTYNYYISGTPGDSVFYKLTNSDGTVTTGAILIDAGGNGHVLVTPPGAGTVTLTLTSVKSGPCTFSTSITQVMTSYALPVAGSITGSGVICGLGNSTTLTNVGGMPGGMWVSSTSDIDQTGGTWPNAIITGYMTGHATIHYTVTNQCGTSTAYFGVDVYAPTEDIFYISGDPDYFCPGTTYNYWISGTPGDSVTYTLVNSNGVSTTGTVVIAASGVGHVLVTPPIVGTGTVTLTLTGVTSGPCHFSIQKIQKMTVRDCRDSKPGESENRSLTGVGQQNDLALTIAPNPNDGNFKLHQNIEPDGALNVKVINAIGETILDRPVQFTSGECSLRLDNSAPGFYFVAITGSNGQRVLGRIVVNK